MAKKKEPVRKRVTSKVVRETKGKSKVAREGKGSTVRVSLSFPKKSWELFRVACEKYSRSHEEVLNEIAVKWAEDMLKDELPPPG
jgi:hypothetical protein